MTIFTSLKLENGKIVDTEVWVPNSCPMRVAATLEEGKDITSNWEGKILSTVAPGFLEVGQQKIIQVRSVYQQNASVGAC